MRAPTSGDSDAVYAPASGEGGTMRDPPSGDGDAVRVPLLGGDTSMYRSRTHLYCFLSSGTTFFASLMEYLAVSPESRSISIGSGTKYSAGKPFSRKDTL